ncbi:hypothetical protein LOAG_09508 [Loa loa]|uniref:Uncharacterized protein n=1 Tax=Loa loa TaxID=7209 RepID=A0A1S0TRT1_LOALO|nr:hypothetical protein LOAG_09508 [Loa loa]EFO18989.1 hypothetical protein LOAG_09508 [Loa loa]
MEIEKRVLQQSPTDLLKCYRDLSLNPPLPLQHHQDISEVEALTKIDNMANNDNDDSVDSDNYSDNDIGIRHLLLKKAKKTEKDDDNDDAKLSSVTFKQHFADFDDEQKEQATTTTIMSDLDFPEFPSFQRHLPIVPVEISRQSHTFVACKSVQDSANSDVNSNSINSIQESIPEVEEESSESLGGKTKHLISSVYSSSAVRQQHRRSVTLTTTPSLVLQTSKILDPIIPFGGDDLEIHYNDRDNDTNNFGSQDRTLNEKRPRIERPRARYPNSTRRTSAPACFWSSASLFPDQQPKSASSSLHDSLVLLQKLLAKQRIMQENVEAFNFDHSGSIPNANNDIAVASQSKISPATIPPHLPTVQALPSPSLLATWQWLRGCIFNSFIFK